MYEVNSSRRLNYHSREGLAIKNCPRCVSMFELCVTWTVVLCRSLQHLDTVIPYVSCPLGQDVKTVQLLTIGMYSFVSLAVCCWQLHCCSCLCVKLSRSVSLVLVLEAICADSSTLHEVLQEYITYAGYCQHSCCLLNKAVLFQMCRIGLGNESFAVVRCLHQRCCYLIQQVWNPNLEFIFCFTSLLNISFLSI